MNKTNGLSIFIILLIAGVVYALWYSSARNAIIAHNEKCDISGTPCPLEIVPRTIWEIITNRSERVAPGYVPGRSGPTNNIPCDQSVTTTPCEILEHLRPEPQPPVKTSSNTVVYSLSDFTFRYPSDASLIEQVKSEGVLCVGIVAISFSSQGTPGVAKVFIATSPFGACTKSNPNAQILADYEKTYRIGDFEEIIYSQKHVTTNGIPMLRQIYGQGYWIDRGGENVLDATVEGGTDHQLRYVFFDGKGFAIITGWQAEP